MVKNLPANAGDAGVKGSIPGSGRFPGIGNGNTVQYFGLENCTDRGAWRATVYNRKKSDAAEHARIHRGINAV